MFLGAIEWFCIDSGQRDGMITKLWNSMTAPPVAQYNPNPKWPGGYVQVLWDQGIEEYVASKVV